MIGDNGVHGFSMQVPAAYLMELRTLCKSTLKRRSFHWLVRQ